MKKLSITIIVLNFIMILSSAVYSQFLTDIVDSAKAGNVKRLSKQLDENSYTSTNIKIALFAAIANHRTEAVSVIIKHVDLKDRDLTPNDFTPLIAALEYPDIVKILVDGGADVNAPSDSNQSALEYAVINRNYDVAEYLLLKGCDPNINNWFCDPLINENISKQKKLIRLLVEKGVDLEKELGKKVLASAIEMEDYELIDYLLKGGARYHLPKIFSVSMIPSSKMYIYLLEKGVPKEDAHTLSTALYLAAGGKNEALKYYLDHCSKLDESQLKRIYTSAGVNNNFEIIKALLSKGYKIEKETFVRILEDSISRKHFSMFEEILNYSKESNGTKNEIILDKDTITKIKANVLKLKKEQAWFDFLEKKKYDEAYELLDKY
ncbi:ankyrin repeat domain-containing protein [Pseudobacteroides cellulosolvens]|uniref:Ankyrin repeat-containing domain-containing protein n=1 Tax=Pseudobacteroides cellulosolvens ATCC 35603 = DSM 2933 TaxID=398512 RepID=A0A0L6JU59_9FIRM|nr:ankyrin repeat domain-containing protein [Pseudobacteroides cellulosolvens]KNY29249.1 Ankyrin repeat-containing domain-containing protein [Pseudobacteroides cellulosolvens ATCC 35603 = DSM 2933]